MKKRRFNWKLFRRRTGDEAGQVVVEYAIIFPIQLMMTLAIMQLAHIFVAKQVLEYAAFCAARAAIVGLDDDAAKAAAVIPISGIAGRTGVEVADTEPIEIPGWGELPRSVAAAAKTAVAVSHEERNGTPVVRAEVDHDYELSVPFGDMVAYSVGQLFMGSEDFDKTTYGSPHMKIHASCLLARPWEEK